MLDRRTTSRQTAARRSRAPADEGSCAADQKAYWTLDEIWLPGSRFRGLSVERLDAWHGPLYALFEAEFGTRMIGASERLKAVAADRPRARALQVAEGAPLLLVERVSWTYDEQPVELRRGYCVTDRHHYFNRLS